MITLKEGLNSREISEEEYRKLQEDEKRRKIQLVQETDGVRKLDKMTS